MRRKEKRIRTIKNQKATRIRNRARKAKGRARKSAALATRAKRRSAKA